MKKLDRYQDEVNVVGTHQPDSKPFTDEVLLKYCVKKPSPIRPVHKLPREGSRIRTSTIVNVVTRLIILPESSRESVPGIALRCPRFLARGDAFTYKKVYSLLATCCLNPTLLIKIYE